MNKLLLNVEKSKFMIYFKHPKKIPELNLTINNRGIEQVDTFNFLGITLDEHITWKQHSDKITIKISRVIGLLRRLQRILPSHILLTIYNSLIQSHLNYGLLLWGYKNNRIVNLQKKAIRVVAYRPYIAHTTPLFKELRLIKVDDLYNIQLHKLYFRYRKNLLPEYFNLFRPSYSDDLNHGHNLRHNRVRLPLATREYVVQGTRYQFLKLISTLTIADTNRTQCPSLYEYIRPMKNALIYNYDPLCYVINCYVCNNT